MTFYPQSYSSPKGEETVKWDFIAWILYRTEFHCIKRTCSEQTLFILPPLLFFIPLTLSDTQFHYILPASLEFAVWPRLAFAIPTPPCPPKGKP